MAETAQCMLQWVTLRLNFRLKGYVLHQYLRAFRCGNGYTTIMLLEVCSQRNFVAEIIRLQLNFIFKKQKKMFLSHPLEDSGIMYALHL